MDPFTTSPINHKQCMDYIVVLIDYLTWQVKIMWSIVVNDDLTVHILGEWNKKLGKINSLVRDYTKYFVRRKV